MKRWVRPALVSALLLTLLVGLGQIPDPNAVDSLTFTPLVQYTPAPPSEAEQIPCYVTKSGKKYHLDRTCPSLRASKSIREISLEEALGRYQPCLRCAGE